MKINNNRNSNAIRGSVGYRTTQVFIYLFAGLIGIMAILPFLYVLGGSFATERELYERPFLIIPHEFSLNAYKFILDDGRILKLSLIHI